MAAAMPQPPPMAHYPQAGSSKGSPLTSGQSSKSQSPNRALSNEFSPFSPTSSTHVGSPVTTTHPKSPSLDSHRALGIAVSEKSSFSSMSSGASSPASLSYSPAVQSALRDSCQSSTSSHHSTTPSPQQLNKQLQRDPEKQSGPARNSNRAVDEQTRTSHYHISSYGQSEGEEDEDFKIENKAMRILLYLSFPNCLVSFVILMYTLLALLTTVLLQPIRICTNSGSFRQQIVGFLAPTLRIQLAYIYSAYSADDYSAPMLVMVNLLSPLISLGVAGGAWVAAAFWFFNAILGDPDGSDKPKGYNDGRASVMGVRSWWEKWLRRPLRG